MEAGVGTGMLKSAHAPLPCLCKRKRKEANRGKRKQHKRGHSLEKKVSAASILKRFKRSSKGEPW